MFKGDVVIMIVDKMPYCSDVERSKYFNLQLSSVDMDKQDMLFSI